MDLDGKDTRGIVLEQRRENYELILSFFVILGLLLLHLITLVLKVGFTEFPFGSLVHLLAKLVNTTDFRVFPLSGELFRCDASVRKVSDTPV